MARKVKDRRALPVSSTMAKVAAVLALAAAGTWFTYTSKAIESYDKAEAENLTAQRELSASSARLAGLRSGKEKNAGTLLAKARELDLGIPNAVDKVLLLSDVDKLTSQTGVTLVAMNAAEDAPVGQAVASQFDVNVTGTRSQVNEFLEGLLRSEQVMTYANLNLAGQDEKSASATFRLRVWSSALKNLKTLQSEEAQGGAGDKK